MVERLSSKKKVAELGAGKIGSILLQSFLRDGLLSPGQTWATVAHSERARIHETQLVISVAASVPTEMIERALEKEVPVVRAMPNTPCVLGAGMTALCKGKFAARQHLEEIGRAHV